MVVAATRLHPCGCHNHPVGERFPSAMRIAAGGGPFDYRQTRTNPTLDPIAFPRPRSPAHTYHALEPTYHALPLDKGRISGQGMVGARDKSVGARDMCAASRTGGTRAGLRPEITV